MTKSSNSNENMAEGVGFEPNPFQHSRGYSARKAQKRNREVALNSIHDHSINKRVSGAEFMGLLVTILRIFGLYPTQKKRTGKAQTWREAASSGNGRIIYDGLKKEMAGPAGKTISRLLLESCRRTPSTRELPEQVIRYIHRESIKGRRAKGIAASLERRLPGIPKGQLESIVGTVIGKAETARERADCQKLGLDWYSWRTSCDARVRESHRIMEGVLVAWADPPAFGHAGEEDGCRCYPEPVLSIDSLTWPARVYRNGLIQNMTKAQFKRLQKQ